MKKSLLLAIPVLIVLAISGVALSKPDAEERNWIDQHVWESFPRAGFRLGVVLSDSDTETGKSGLAVTKVLPGSPAEKAGIQEGDIIVSINGERVRASRDVREFLRSLDEAQEVPVVLRRDGQEMTVTVKPEKRDRFVFFQGGKYLGVSLQELDADLASYFQVDPKAGVLISRVEKDSPAEKAGIRSGDVITHINGKKVNTAEDVREFVHSEETTDVEITVLRRGSEQKFIAQLEKREPMNFDSFRGMERHFNRPEFRENMDRLKEEMEDLKRELQDLRKQELDQLRDDIQREIQKEMEQLRKELKDKKNET